MDSHSFCDLHLSRHYEGSGGEWRGGEGRGVEGSGGEWRGVDGKKEGERAIEIERRVGGYQVYEASL